MLPPEIQQLADDLHSGSQCIAAVLRTQMNSNNRFEKALSALQRLADRHSIPIAIVGGLGAIRHGYPAITEDIDIAIAEGDLDRMIQWAKDEGFQISWRAESGWHTLQYGDVEINVVPEGRRARNDAPTVLPGPVHLGVSSGLDYANLPGWFELKLGSFRRKDQTHAVEVLKKQDAASIAAIQAHLTKIHPLYVERFNTLAAEAKAEQEQEANRKPN